MEENKITSEKTALYQDNIILNNSQSIKNLSTLSEDKR